MPFIFNSFSFQLVRDEENWDRLNYVIARKIHVKFKAYNLRKKFAVFGSLEKIEIFEQYHIRFAYTNDRNAMLAMNLPVELIDETIRSIRLAEAHEQPDSSLYGMDSIIQNLQEDLLIEIFTKSLN